MLDLGDQLRDGELAQTVERSARTHIAAAAKATLLRLDLQDQRRDGEIAQPAERRAKIRTAAEGTADQLRLDP
jgi:hypothetical protein